MSKTERDTDLQARLRRLGLFGLVAAWSEIADKPWLEELLRLEEGERTRRSLDRRLRTARIGAFKPMADFDWGWPSRLDRQAVDDLFSLTFLDEGANAVLVGPNGVGKSMILRNLAHHALVRGNTVRFTTASDMLADLAAQESSGALARRMRRYVVPKLLCIDEVGYLSYSSRYADLLFEIVTRRYDAQRPILVSTNKAFSEWSEVFPHAACTVTLVDRLVHRAEIIEIEGSSYRLKEAKERSAKKIASRRKKAAAPTSPSSRGS
jgi:DNA replication protein DnaC